MFIGKIKGIDGIYIANILYLSVYITNLYRFAVKLNILIFVLEKYTLVCYLNLFFKKENTLYIFLHENLPNKNLNLHDRKFIDIMYCASLKNKSFSTL